jgi:LPXTG-site transpeptidase (sortase) family protein
MSETQQKKLTPVVIFDRRNPDASDVPVFSRALKQKVNTPQDTTISDGLSFKTQAILASILSSSRADSSGGQTGGFAQGEEKYKRNETIFEDPSLLRVPRPSILPERSPVLQPLPTVTQVEVEAITIPKKQFTETFWKWCLGIAKLVIQEFPKFIFVLQLAADIFYELILSKRKDLKLPPIAISVSPLSLFKQIGQTLLGSVSTIWQRIPQFNFYAFASRAMIAASLVLMLLTVGPMVALQIQSWRQRINYSVSNMSSNAKDNQPTPMPATPTPSPTPNPDPDKQFQISIPKIGVNSKIIANVDAADETEYDVALKKGVAHAAGTGLPGEENKENKTIFIFGHSTNGTWNISRYNALFYGLKDMTVGDTFSMWFWGKEFHYTVTETKVVEANDISFLIPQTTTDQLILQTCWPPGTSWKRFLVIAKPTN